MAVELCFCDEMLARQRRLVPISAITFDCPRHGRVAVDLRLVGYAAKSAGVMHVLQSPRLGQIGADDATAQVPWGEDLS